MAKRRKIGEVVSNTAPKAPVSPDVTLGNQGKEVISNEKGLGNKSQYVSKLPDIVGAKNEDANKFVSKLPETLNNENKDVKPSLLDEKIDNNQGSTLAGVTKAKPTVIPDVVVKPKQKGESLVTAIQENPVAQVTQNEILNTGVKDASSPSELQQAVQISNEAKKEAEKMEGSIDEAFSDAAKVTAAPYGSFDALDAESEVTAQAGNTVPVGGGAPQPVNVQEQVQTVPGDGTAVTSVVSTGGQPIRPTYEQIATTQDAQQGMANMYAKLNEGVPKAVVEKLGVQDYYPNIGRDIAVGTFSGSRIGSQTIYSGAGALLPMGLYDARKRALKEAATEKKKQLDKFFDVIETAPQYMKAVNESYNNWLNNSLAKHGYDADKFLSDPEMRKEYTRRLTNAKDISYWATWADNYLKEADKKENYGTAEGVKIAGQIKMALVDHMDEIASGQKSLKDFIDIDKAKLYQNIIPQMDAVIKEVLDPNRMGESPINMRTGDAEGRLDPEEFKQQRDQFVVKMKSGTLGKDEYLSGFKKFFTGDYERIIDGLIESGKFSEEQRDAALDYFAGQMQEQIKLNPQFIDNDQMEMARLALDREKFEFEKEQQESFWGVIDQGMNNAVNRQTGKTFEQELAALNKQNLSKGELDNALKRLYNVYSVSTESTVVKNSKGNWVVQIPSTSTQAEQIQTRDVYAPNGKLVRGLNVQVYNPSTKTWESKEMAPREIAKYKNNSKNIRINGKPVTNDQFDGFNASASGMYTKVIGHEITKGYVNKQGAFVPLTSDNLAEYEANPKVTLQRPIEQPYAKVERDKVAPGQTSITEIILPGQTRGEWINISDRAGRMHSDQQSGFTTRQSAQAQGQGNVSASGSTSTSGGSFVGF